MKTDNTSYINTCFFYKEKLSLLDFSENDILDKELIRFMIRRR